MSNIDSLEYGCPYIETMRPFKNIVIGIRNELSKKYDVLNPDSPNYDFTGLCYEATDMIRVKLEEKFGDDVIFVDFHGEQARHPRLNSQLWPLQHDWCKVILKDGTAIYLDATSQQFQKYYTFIPDYIVSFDKPIWYYPDRKNPSWNGWTKKMNENIKIPMKAYDGRKVKEGIVDYMQYEMYGPVCDLVGKLFKLQKKIE